MLLNERDRSADEIKNLLDETSSSIMPQIRILEENDLVVQENGNYRLSEVAHVIINNMKPFVDSIRLFDQYPEYWTKHDIRRLPKHLQRRIAEIKDYKLQKPDLSHLFELPDKLVEDILKSSKVMIFSSFFHPAYPKLLQKLADEGTEISIVLTGSTIDRFKIDHINEINDFLKLENTNIYSYKGECGVEAVVVTNTMMIMRLFFSDGSFSHTRIISHDPSSIKWARELFIYYKNSSESIEKI